MQVILIKFIKEILFFEKIGFLAKLLLFGIHSGKIEMHPLCIGLIR